MKKHILEINEIMSKLNLQALECEGGFYRQTYNKKAESGDYFIATAIYYMITQESFSHLHRLISDEIYHFYLGDPVELFIIFPDAHCETIILGSDIMNGQCLQYTVPAGSWQGLTLTKDGNYALLGTTMAPGFMEKNYEGYEGSHLEQEYPDFINKINKLKW